MSLVPQDPILFEVSGLFPLNPFCTRPHHLLCEKTLIQGTVASNIAYGSPETPREAIERAARQANCDFIWDMKDGFDTKSSSFPWFTSCAII